MTFRKKSSKVGIVGVPPLKIIEMLTRRKAIIYDLDEPLTKTPIEQSAAFIPAVYCAILRTVVVNSISLDLDEIYIDVGPGKCDCAGYTAAILEQALPRTHIIRTRNLDTLDFGTPVCQSRMSLPEKFKAITASVQSPTPHTNHRQCQPTAGFWGVPPRDFSLLELFPDTTHIYGWTRCMENKTPDNIALEQHCNGALPTVFFAQTFCGKTALAHHLASRHPRSLYVDCDVKAGNSAKAKIQAFLELSGVYDASG